MLYSNTRSSLDVHASMTRSDPPERPPAPTFPDDPHPSNPSQPMPAPEPTPSPAPDISDPIPLDTHW